MQEPPAYNPAQEEVVELLGAGPEQRPTFDAGLRVELRAMLEDELEPVVADLDEPLWVAKRDLAGVHGCEVRHLAEGESRFAWSPPLARGAVTHKAIELSVSWRGERIPGDLVDEAIARLGASEASLADWLSTCDDGDLAELRSAAVERVTAFVECFPPLRSRWYPVTEAKLRAELLEGRLVLAGKVDLSLGKADGTTAGKVLIDLKTGGFAPSHLDDLRYYALVETLRLGTPPRKLASYYLDGARAHPEDVTEDLLEAAARRVVAGATRLVELRRDPSVARTRPGPACRWCALSATCDDGRRFLDGDDRLDPPDPDDDPDDDLDDEQDDDLDDERDDLDDEQDDDLDDERDDLDDGLTALDDGGGGPDRPGGGR
ncbi:MAG: PD-(D/E)XK nuclease family protein [Acidimicrobiales bacterium]